MEIEINKLLRTKEIAYHIVPLGYGLAGFVYRSRRDRYHIFISINLTYEAQLRTFFHEAWHAIVDMPHMPYVIGIDTQGKRFEVAAEEQAKYFCMST